MGVVYQARHLRLGRVVALKVLRPDRDHLAEEGQRLRREASAVARLSHPNIVQVFEVGECAGRPYLALEHVPGGNLAETLARTPLAPAAAAALVATLARALAYAHRAGVLHRDLKPSNVLLSADGTPKVTDFGL